MNYLVVRDDLGGFDRHTPSFNGWWFADDVDLAERGARYRGQFGVDTDLYVAVPAQVKLYKDTFIHDQCEPIVARQHQARFGKRFSEKQVLCRVEGRKGQGFLFVLFPYKSHEPRPAIENWQGEKGVKVIWKGETHYVLLDTRPHEIDADGIKARAACLLVKATDAENFTLGLPDGGRAAFRSQTLEGQGPLEVVVAAGKARKSACTDLMNQALTLILHHLADSLTSADLGRPSALDRERFRVLVGGRGVRLPLQHIPAGRDVVERDLILRVDLSRSSPRSDL